MKILKLFLLSIFFTNSIVSAQEQAQSAIIMSGNPRPWGNDDLYRLANWMKVHYHKPQFSGTQMKGKNYYVVSKEIWNGMVTKTDTIFNSGANIFFQPVEHDTLAFSVMAGKTDSKTFKVEFIFERFSVNTVYECKDTDDYSFRMLSGKELIEPGKAFYAFVYMLPYEKGNEKFYCAVEASGKDIEKWGTEFGIEHYILFEMKFY